MSIAPYILIAFALVGLGDTAYLSYFVYHGAAPGCLILNGCETVLNSVYSKPFGVPFAYIGLVYYFYMLALGVLLAVEPRSRALAWAALAYTGVGLLLSIGFELFQFYIIGAMCMYCAISALTTLGLFATSVSVGRTAHAAQ